MPTVMLENHGPIAVIRLSNGVTNPIGKRFVEELSAAIIDIKDQRKGLVLAGNTKFFSIGLDVPNLLLLGRDEMADFWRRFEDLVLCVYTLPIPTACAMAGHATGGGAILLPVNRERLAARGTVVFLDTTIDQQLARTRRSQHRPLLATDDRRAKLEELMRVRDPLYRSIAKITVRTDGRAAAAVAGDIEKALGNL